MMAEWTLTTMFDRPYPPEKWRKVGQFRGQLLPELAIPANTFRDVLPTIGLYFLLMLPV